MSGGNEAACFFYRQYVACLSYLRIMRKVFFCLLLMAEVAIVSRAQDTAARKISLPGRAQGTTYHITYFAKDSNVTASQIDSIFISLDSSLSIYKPWSTVSRFNRSSEGIEMDRHLEKVVNKGLEAFVETKGVFDITIYPITDIWGFGLTRTTALPSSTQIAGRMKCVGSQYLSRQGNRLLKKYPCVSLDLNGIAQGYSCDVIAGFLESNRVNDYIVEIGGEMRMKGTRPGKQPLRIAIETPGEDPWEVSHDQKIIAPPAGGITSSGSYRKFRESGGKKVSHILDARTGRPAVNELISVTVWAKDALTADAYDNALMAMGLKKALAFCASHPGISAYFIYKKKDGSIAGIASQHFPPFIDKE